MTSKQNAQSYYVWKKEGDFGWEPEPEITGEIASKEVILGKDDRAVDNVKALGETINALWHRKGSWEELTNMPREESDAFVPTEPGASSLLQVPEWHCYEDKADTYDEFADGCRVCVWRNSHWFPVSGSQLEQIQGNLIKGNRIFDVCDGELSWTIDARKKSEWVQISPAQTRRPLRCTPTILYHDTVSDLVNDIKAEWYEIVGDAQQMKFEDLLHYYRGKSDLVAIDFDEQLFYVTDEVFRRAEPSSRGPVAMQNWIHCRLLEAQAPSLHAVEQINHRMDVWMTRYPDILKCFVHFFTQACKEIGSSRILPSQMKSIVQTWLEKTADDMLTPEYSAHLDYLMTDHNAFEEGEAITYYEFLLHMTGQTWSTVELYFYDLTKGSAKWWTPVLFGHSMSCLWHCGVVAFGKEYRYGGNIFESQPGATAFGSPEKTVTVGSTWRSRQDLLSFINRSLAHSFAADSYQVLSNNSNHFCDRLTMFLVNKHITDEVLDQPKQIMSSKVVQSLSHWLPWLKGTPAKRTCAEITNQRDWDSIEDNMLVNYEYEDGWTVIARVIKKYDCSCDLRWYCRRDFEFHVIRGVARSAVQPIFVASTSPVQTLRLPQRKF